MSEPSRPREEWPPELGGDALRGRMKWGWDASTGEVVAWSVSGPGDGRPFHKEFLTSAWGREPSHSGGDLVGVAALTVASEDAGLEEVVVESYYGGAVPAAVVEWFGREFPAAVIRARVVDE